MTKNNTYPEITEEQKNVLFKEHQEFLHKYVNYEINTLQKLENVYRGIDDNSKLRKYIKNNRCTLWVPTISTLFLLMPVILFIKSFFWSGLITSFFIAIISIILWGVYFDNDNKRGSVLVNAYNDLKENEIIESHELISLKALISESEMVDLLRCYNREIPVSKIVDLFDHYRYDFRNWEATQIYLEI